MPGAAAHGARAALMAVTRGVYSRLHGTEGEGEAQGVKPMECRVLTDLSVGKVRGHRWQSRFSQEAGGIRLLRMLASLMEGVSQGSYKDSGIPLGFQQPGTPLPQGLTQQEEGALSELQEDVCREDPRGATTFHHQKPAAYGTSSGKVSRD